MLTLLSMPEMPIIMIIAVGIFVEGILSQIHAHLVCHNILSMPEMPIIMIIAVAISGEGILKFMLTSLSTP